MLAKDGIAAIGPITFHSLRRTVSLRCACGDDVAYAASQLGHEDACFTLRVYAQATKRRERLSGAHLRAYDRAIHWARMGTNDEEERVLATAEATKTPPERGFCEADERARTVDLLHGKQTLYQLSYIREGAEYSRDYAAELLAQERHDVVRVAGSGRASTS